MPSDDYTTGAIGGGLKLKGSKPLGITKTKKKKKDKLKAAGESTDEVSSARDVTTLDGENGKGKGKKAEITDDIDAEELERLEGEAYGGGGGGKTEAERKHEEMKWKRVCLTPPVTLKFPYPISS